MALERMTALATSLRASMPEAEDVKTLPNGAAKLSVSAIAKAPAAAGNKPRPAKVDDTRRQLPLSTTGSRRTAREGGADSAQMAADYDEVRTRYEEVLRENEALKADANRRIESTLRRERKYEAEIVELRNEIARQTRVPGDDSMSRLRDEHKRVLEGVTNLKQQTASVLAEQERDLLRAFRARLYDVQIELERVRSKKDDGALEWIEKTRSLEKELDWSREEALRLDRINQFLTKESSSLKTQVKSYEDDRELLVRKMLGLKKENERLKTGSEGQSPTPPSQSQPASRGASSASLTFPHSTSAAGLLRPKTSGAAPARAASTSCQADGNGSGAFDVGGDGEATLATQQQVKELNAKQAEMEAKHKESVNKLKRLLEVERRNLRAVRAAHAKDLQDRSELESLLRACVDDVRREIAAQRAGGQGSTKEQLSVGSMTPADRERVLELLLSQERVVTLLYEKAFPTRPQGSGSMPSALGSSVVPEEGVEAADSREMAVSSP